MPERAFNNFRVERLALRALCYQFATIAREEHRSCGVCDPLERLRPEIGILIESSGARSGEGKTRPSSERTEGSKRRSSFTISPAIGTARRALSVFGALNAPFVNCCATVMLAASRLTSDQRSPASSPNGRPVETATRIQYLVVVVVVVVVAGGGGAFAAGSLTPEIIDPAAGTTL